MYTLGELSPAGEATAAGIDAGEVGPVSGFNNGGVDAEGYGDEASSNEAHSTFGPLHQILHHLLVGSPGFFTHGDIAHGSHDDTVLDGHFVDFDGREEGCVWPQVLRHFPFVGPVSGEKPIFIAVD